MARYTKYIIAPQDTLQSIAQNEMGSVFNWEEIAEYNNLEYPYIVDTPEQKARNSSHLVTIGDTIIIPVEVDLLDTDVASLGHRDKELIMGLALGRDLAISYQEESFANKGLHGESFGLETTNTGDLKTATGIDNLKQAVINQLLTPKGTLLLHPNYGSHLYKYIGARATHETMVMLEDEILSTIQQDMRVENVTVVGSKIIEDRYYGEFIINIYSLKEYFELVVQMEETGNFTIS